jgi:hypothetical protein
MDRRVKVPGADILLEIIHASSMSLQRVRIHPTSSGRSWGYGDPAFCRGAADESRSKPEEVDAREPASSISYVRGRHRSEAGKVGVIRHRFSQDGFSISTPPYAALWHSSIWRIQLVSGFHLAKIRATLSRRPARESASGRPMPFSAASDLKTTLGSLGAIATLLHWHSKHFRYQALDCQTHAGMFPSQRS